MREHDLLVHAARWETFGVSITEAVAAGMPLLVTRCGGPEHILAGLENAAGQMIDVEENAESIIAGYHRLRERFPDGLDLDRARLVLGERFGIRRSPKRTTGTGSPRPARSAKGDRSERPVPGTRASRQPAIVAESARVVAEGGTATVLTRKPTAWAKNPLPDGVEAVELPALQQGYRPAAVRFLLLRVPRLLLRMVRPVHGRVADGGLGQRLGSRLNSFIDQRKPTRVMPTDQAMDW
jgi:hypothetical protein